MILQNQFFQFIICLIYQCREIIIRPQLGDIYQKLKNTYNNHLFNYERKSLSVSIGDSTIGGSNPIRIQS